MKLFGTCYVHSLLIAHMYGYCKYLVHHLVNMAWDLGHRRGISVKYNFFMLYLRCSRRYKYLCKLPPASIAYYMHALLQVA
jgi:hypothetical protein